MMEARKTGRRNSRGNLRWPEPRWSVARQLIGGSDAATAARERISRAARWLRMPDNIILRVDGSAVWAARASNWSSLGYEQRHAWTHKRTAPHAAWYHTHATTRHANSFSSTSARLVLSPRHFCRFDAIEHATKFPCNEFPPSFFPVAKGLCDCRNFVSKNEF